MYCMPERECFFFLIMTFEVNFHSLIYCWPNKFYESIQKLKIFNNFIF